jgi:choline dehydrogenase-like flavoprotein
MADEFDAIVVGSGAAGGWAAKELAESGLRVLVLEAGPSIRTEIAAPRPEPTEGGFATRFLHGLARQPIQMRCPAYNAGTRRYFVDDVDHPYTTPAGQPYNWFRGRQVGGRMRTWGRVVVRMSDLEFKAASRDGQGTDWPLRYADLSPCYDKVEAFLGVRGCTDAIGTVPDGVFRDRAHMTPAELAFKSAVEASYPERRVIAARVADHDPSSLGATLRAARATGRMTLQSDAIVRNIVVDPSSGRATGVSYVDRTSRTERVARAKSVVLCAGTIESVRILLNSACSRHPGGLGNSSGRLGTGFTDHLLVGVGGPLRGTGATIDPAQAAPGDIGNATGFYIPRFRNVERPHGAFRRGYAIQGGIGRGRAWYMMAHGEMMSRERNRIGIDPGRRDAWGIPVARIDCTWSDNDLAMIDDASRALRQMAEVAGLTIRMPPSGSRLEGWAYRAWRRKVVSASGAFLPGSAIHELGGAAMGRDCATSVVDAWGRCWDARNVFVTDGACFASGCSQNVTLTIMALTVRACDRLASELRAGAL